MNRCGPAAHPGTMRFGARTERRLAYLMLACALLLPVTTFAQGGKAPPAVAWTGKPVSTDEQKRGKAVFAEWCAGCHAAGPRRPGTQALDALYKGKKPGVIEERTDLVPKLTETFVRRGVSVMPAFRKTEISDADLAALAAYLAPPRP